MPSTTAFSPAAWRTAISEYIARHPDRPLKLRALARALDLPDGHYAAYRALVREMLDDGSLALGRARVLVLPPKPTATPSGNTFTGVFRGNMRGFGFLEVPDQPDLFVQRHHTGNALDGDIVEARKVRPRRGDDRPRAEVVRVIEHAETHWVGILERDRNTWFVQPLGKMPAPRVVIEDPTAKSAQPGDMVVVEPIDKKLNPDSVRGVIIDRLGEPGRSQTKVRAVAARNGLPEQFPHTTRDAARAAIEGFDDSAWTDRRDLRDLLTITIDPADARDFDDAISLRTLPGNQVELGVHIADVAHFVKPGSALDTEAYKRGNSTYLPGYVIPMLPEVLSNGVCSLQPDQPRLTKSAFITYDDRAEAVSARFANTVIQSHARLTYEQATNILEGKTGRFDPDVVELLRAAATLAKKIRIRRRRNGMISLSLPSVEIKLDADGNARDTEIADTSFSHTLIEMFMVEANDSACRLFSRLNLPHLRRIHPDPAPDALDTLSASLVALGVHPPKDLQHESIQHLLDAVAGRPEETSANYLLLRSLSQATYSPAPLGHFALASREYTHFTSPIRRYADLVVHRLLDDVIKVQRAEPGAIADAINAPDDERLAEIGRHISATERRSQQAEREARHWLLVELMVDRVGESFDAVITGALSIGVFVQLQPMLVEGLVRVADFGGDEWRFDPVSNRFVGRHTGRAIAFGQRMRVILAAVDEMAGELTLLPDRSASIGAGRGVARKSQSTPQAKTQAKGKATSPKRTAKSTARAPRSGKKRSR